MKYWFVLFFILLAATYIVLKTSLKFYKEVKEKEPAFFNKLFPVFKIFLVVKNQFFWSILFGQCYRLEDKELLLKSKKLQKIFIVYAIFALVVIVLAPMS